MASLVHIRRPRTGTLGSMRTTTKPKSILVFASPDGGHVSRLAAALCTASRARRTGGNGARAAPSRLTPTYLARVSPARKPPGGAIVKVGLDDELGVIAVQAVGRHGGILQRLVEGAARDVFAYPGPVVLVDLKRFHGRALWLAGTWDRLFPGWRFPGLWLAARDLNRRLDELRTEVEAGEAAVRDTASDPA